ncbi:YjzD family protein [Peribacillus kribbensis]|uniref:YjzD family protein n=1 Tax=Peribacillus kribbensis TaxID=356658 RepID=UPI00047CD037|nr:YjzD family protein [Peribacillus kribbensis]
MKVFWTFFWTFLLVEMLTYVVSSMNGVDPNYAQGAILGVVVTVLILIVSAIIPDEPVKKTQH